MRAPCVVQGEPPRHRVPGEASAAASISGPSSRSRSERAGEPQALRTATSALTSSASGSRGETASQWTSHSSRLYAKVASRATYRSRFSHSAASRVVASSFAAGSGSARAAATSAGASRSSGASSSTSSSGDSAAVSRGLCRTIRAVPIRARSNDMVRTIENRR